VQEQLRVPGASPPARADRVKAKRDAPRKSRSTRWSGYSF